MRFDVPYPPLPGVKGAALVEDPVGSLQFRQLTPDDLGAAFLITSFAMTGFAVKEIGSVLHAPAFTASTSTAPDSTAGSVVLTNNDNGESVDASAHPTSFASAQDYTRSANNASILFTLTEKKGSLIKVATISQLFQPRLRWGVSSSSTYNQAFIDALASSGLAAARGGSFAFTTGAGQRFFRAFPASYGIPTYVVGGAPADMTLFATVSWTNAFGVAQNDAIWGTTNANLGTLTLVES